MKKVLGLAILASLIATPALAGETFVRNEWTNTHSNTTTDLTLDSDTHSTRNELYYSNADKKYVSVDYSTGGDKYDLKSEIDKLGGSGKTKEFTYHTASSGLVGKFTETNNTYVDGTIFTESNSKSKAHETTSGVR